VKIQWRHVVAIVLLVFAWKGSSLRMSWPLAERGTVIIKTPGEAAKRWVEPLRGKVSGMLPADRQYLANFYDAMQFIVSRDAKRDPGIMATNADFATFHAGSLKSAIDREDVGKYPGLGTAIDEVFVNALGADIKPLDAAGYERLEQACGALAWTFAVNGDG